MRGQVTEFEDGRLGVVAYNDPQVAYEVRPDGSELKRIRSAYADTNGELGYGPWSEANSDEIVDLGGQPVFKGEVGGETYYISAQNEIIRPQEDGSYLVYQPRSQFAGQVLEQAEQLSVGDRVDRAISIGITRGVDRDNELFARQGSLERLEFDSQEFERRLNVITALSKPNNPESFEEYVYDAIETAAYTLRYGSTFPLVPWVDAISMLTIDNMLADQDMETYLNTTEEQRFLEGIFTAGAEALGDGALWKVARHLPGADRAMKELAEALFTARRMLVPGRAVSEGADVLDEAIPEVRRAVAETPRAPEMPTAPGMPGADPSVNRTIGTESPRVSRVTTPETGPPVTQLPGPDAPTVTHMPGGDPIPEVDVLARQQSEIAPNRTDIETPQVQTPPTSRRADSNPSHFPNQGSSTPEIPPAAPPAPGMPRPTTAVAGQSFEEEFAQTVAESDVLSLAQHMSTLDKDQYSEPFQKVIKRIEATGEFHPQDAGRIAREYANNANPELEDLYRRYLIGRGEDPARLTDEAIRRNLNRQVEALNVTVEPSPRQASRRQNSRPSPEVRNEADEMSFNRGDLPTVADAQEQFETVTAHEMKNRNIRVNDLHGQFLEEQGEFLEASASDFGSHSFHHADGYYTWDDLAGSTTAFPAPRNSQEAALQSRQKMQLGYQRISAISNHPDPEVAERVMRESAISLGGDGAVIVPYTEFSRGVNERAMELTKYNYRNLAVDSQRELIPGLQGTKINTYSVSIPPEALGDSVYVGSYYSDISDGTSQLTTSVIDSPIARPLETALKKSPERNYRQHLVTTVKDYYDLTIGGRHRLESFDMERLVGYVEGADDMLSTQQITEAKKLLESYNHFLDAGDTQAVEGIAQQLDGVFSVADTSRGQKLINEFYGDINGNVGGNAIEVNGFRYPETGIPTVQFEEFVVPDMELGTIIFSGNNLAGDSLTDDSLGRLLESYDTFQQFAQSIKEKYGLAILSDFSEATAGKLIVGGQNLDEVLPLVRQDMQRIAHDVGTEIYVGITSSSRASGAPVNIVYTQMGDTNISLQGITSQTDAFTSAMSYKDGKTSEYFLNNEALLITEMLDEGIPLDLSDSDLVSIERRVRNIHYQDFNEVAVLDTPGLTPEIRSLVEAGTEADAAKRAQYAPTREEIIEKFGLIDDPNYNVTPLPSS